MEARFRVGWECLFCPSLPCWRISSLRGSPSQSVRRSSDTRKQNSVFTFSGVGVGGGGGEMASEHKSPFFPS